MNSTEDRTDTTTPPDGSVTPRPSVTRQPEVTDLSASTEKTGSDRAHAVVLEVLADTDSSLLDPNPETRLSNDRLALFRELHEVEFLAILKECDFEYGFESMADRFIQARLKDNPFVTMHWLGVLFFEHIADVDVAVGILRVLSHLDYSQAFPVGISIALNAVLHKNEEVRECGIRAFENWRNPHSLRILEQIRFADDWVGEYARGVIRDLRSEVLAEHAR